MGRIFVECKPDKALVEKLGFTKKDIEDAGDKSRVYAQLKRERNLIAIVDEDINPDPNTPKYPYEKELRRMKEQHGMILCEHPGSRNKVIILRGKLEDWLIFICKKNDVDIEKYGLSNNSKELHKTINYKLDKYRELLEHLIKKESKELATLKEWLQL